MIMSLLTRRMVYTTSRSTPTSILHSIVTDTTNSWRTATNLMNVCQSNRFISNRVSARSLSLFRFGNSRLGRQDNKIPSVRRHSLNIASAHMRVAVTARLSIVQRCILRDFHAGGRVFTTVTRRCQPLPVGRSAGPGSVHRTKLYSIPSSLLGDNLVLQFPRSMLSLSHYSTDGGNGPSRFPQVNPPNQPSSSRWARGLGLVSAGSLLFSSTKYAFVAMKVTKFASLGSMVLSIGAYSMIFGWPYAVGIVGLIFCHECGHLAMMLQRGIPFSPMVFIPFSTY
jgi:hypothetical protein